MKRARAPGKGPGPIDGLSTRSFAAVFKNPWSASAVWVLSPVANDEAGEEGSSPSPGTIPAPALNIAGSWTPFFLDSY